MIGTYGAGVWLLDKYTHQYKRLPGSNKIFNINEIFAIEPDSFLFLTTSGVFSYSFAHPVLTQQWREIRTNVLSILPIKGKGFGLGFDNGICEVDLEGKRILRQYSHNPLDSTSLRDNVVFELHLDSKGDLYLATSNGGVNVLPKGKKAFHQLPLQQNPANIYGIIEISKDSILFLGGEGVYLYLPSQNRSLLLNRDNGLQVGTFAQFGYSFNGEAIYFTGGEGAVRLERSQLPLLFSDSLSIEVIGPYVQNKQVSIPAGMQQLQLEIVNPNKGALTNIQYSYFLTNLDQEWHEVKTSHEINYPYIPPGEYTLLVRAIDPNGIITPQTISIQVSVLPLWFQTWWFTTLMICLAVVVLIFAVRYFSYLRLQWNLKALEAKQKVAEERLRISRELHDNVGSQLTYLITGLEASEVMLEQQHTQKLSSNLEQLQVSARDSMQQLRDAIWALNKEEMTLQLLAERFKSWTLRMFENQPTETTFDINIQHNFQLDAIATLSIFRLLQEAVHNCIKHAHATSICISIHSKEHSCTFSIADNGVGFTETGEGSGLDNMKTRAQQIGAELTIKSEVKQGTTVTLVFQNRL
jgi:signal transduction histidine kinase